ncbi:MULTISPECIES: hypothetical protein [Streptomyces]|uniref:hypothetical protein n=1 Tax=Streptomyces TaxID=1883 RepID=UPI00210BBC7D|nr:MULTISPECIES: hypothetical protein [Streptomyces]UUA11604.1 hypothetical protein NNW98_39000 [Streptomyces koelreuteriae]UUA19191.1 hypothetical protein NNW99_38815 [Streptomyces sp. CRCS-T-1]
MTPVPHERTPDRPTPARPHPQRTAQHDKLALARPDRSRSVIPTVISLPRTQDEVGPRGPGAIYQNVNGRFEVLALITNPSEAAQLLRRGSARWAVIVRDTLRPDGQPFAVGSVWTTSDYLVRPAKEAAPSAAFAPAA